jgi:hypothetical protein
MNPPILQQGSPKNWAWPHILVSLKNHATAIFGLGKNFFL